MDQMEGSSVISPFPFLNLHFLASSHILHHGVFGLVIFSGSSAVLPPSGLKAYFRASSLMANNTSLEMKLR